MVADVGCGEVVKQLLGAANLRDIGYHFPDTDERYRGIDSKQLLSETVSLIEKQGFHVGNVDATVCAEAPKLNPYIAEMQKVLSSLMHIELEDVSIKATTAEQLGFTGRREGMSAYAVVLIEKVG